MDTTRRKGTGARLSQANDPDRAPICKLPPFLSLPPRGAAHKWASVSNRRKSLSIVINTAIPSPRVYKGPHGASRSSAPQLIEAPAPAFVRQERKTLNLKTSPALLGIAMRETEKGHTPQLGGAAL